MALIATAWKSKMSNSQQRLGLRHRSSFIDKSMPDAQETDRGDVRVSSRRKGIVERLARIG